MFLFDNQNNAIMLILQMRKLRREGISRKQHSYVWYDQESNAILSDSRAWASTHKRKSQSIKPISGIAT